MAASTADRYDPAVTKAAPTNTLEADVVALLNEAGLSEQKREEEERLVMKVRLQCRLGVGKRGVVVV